jgi:hypothetical protein
MTAWNNNEPPAIVAFPPVTPVASHGPSVAMTLNLVSTVEPVALDALGTPA